MTVNPEYDDVMESVLDAISGAKVQYAMGATFCAFIGACKHARIDAGRQFEDLLSQYEDRVKATHRGSASVN